MTRMGAACVVSSGYGLRRGSAATMTVFPIVPDFDKYPQWGKGFEIHGGRAGNCRPLDKTFATRYVFV